MTQRIILFNGPPRSGKDTAAKYVFDTGWMKDNHHVVFDRMSMPIKKAFAGMMATPIDKWGNVEYYEAHKEESIGTMFPSYRQWQIDFSERFMKRLYGEPIFANLFIQRALRQHKDAVILVPDCGFDIEYKTLATHFGPENILVVKIFRTGFTFEGDSRNYLKVGSDFINDDYNGGPSTASNVRHVTNSGPQIAFEAKILTLVKDWLS